MSWQSRSPCCVRPARRPWLVRRTRDGARRGSRTGAKYRHFIHGWVFGFDTTACAASYTSPAAARSPAHSRPSPQFSFAKVPISTLIACWRRPARSSERMLRSIPRSRSPHSRHSQPRVFSSRGAIASSCMVHRDRDCSVSRLCRRSATLPGPGRSRIRAIGSGGARLCLLSRSSASGAKTMSIRRSKAHGAATRG